MNKIKISDLLIKIDDLQNHNAKDRDLADVASIWINQIMKELES